MKVDLHTHTTGSDGKQTVQDIIQKAKASGTQVIAITDHDFMYPQSFCVKEAAEKGIHLFHGVELAFSWKGEINEVLGYGVDAAKLAPFIESVQWRKKESEYKNLEELYSAFVKRGFILSPLENLMAELQGSNKRAGNVIFSDIYNFNENNALIKELEIDPSKGIYDTYLNNKKSPLYFGGVSSYAALAYAYSSLEEVSKALRESGALVFMAHALHLRNPKEWCINMLDYAITNKLIDGIEVWHTKHPPESIKYLYDLAQKNNLLISGGSDNHYPDKPLGVLPDGTTITDAEMPWLKKIINKK